MSSLGLSGSSGISAGTSSTGISLLKIFYNPTV